MKRVSRIASRGGVALSVVGLGIACHEISQTDDVGKKNEILVESLGGLAGGIAFGVGVGIVLMATPVGWIAALAIGAGGALAGYGGGKIASGVYDASGRKIDFAGKLGVTTVCSKGRVEKPENSAPKMSSAALSAL